MTELQKQFIEAYEAAGRTITGQAAELFQELLEKEFDDDPEKMTAFIDSLQEPEPAAISLEDLQAAMVELTNMILGG
jgi:hypothetical protein|nr:MAG TPA: DNA polymerases epsilon N terminal [Caudoviricetes sp.]